MKRTLITFGLLMLSALSSLKILAACGSYFQPEGPDTFDGATPGQGLFYKPAHWHLFFTDGHETRDVQVREPATYYGSSLEPTYCYPGFDRPFWQASASGTAIWNQVTHNPKRVYSPSIHCVYDNPEIKKPSLHILLREKWCRYRRSALRYIRVLRRRVRRGPWPCLFMPVREPRPH
jgi:hypothetical protein